LGNEAGFIRPNISVEKPEQLDSAITWIKKGIEKFPQRLDLRMGYSTLYRMLDDAEKMYSIMEQTIDWMLKNPNTQLTWTSDNTIERNPIIEDSMQDYFTNCYYSTAHKEYAEKFADLGLRFSPKNAMFWNDKAVLKLDKDDIQGALELMEKALSFNPDDELIKDNINHLKKMLEEKK
jgi:tetratricopeptide (TPR) repeat protein